MKIYKQETGKSCGIACLRSIINHFGDNFSEKDILEKHEFYETKMGVMNPVISLGVTALKFGFKVDYYGYNLMLVGNGNIRDILNERKKNFFEYGKFVIDKALEFLDNGGKIHIDKLNIKTLKKLIKENGFIIVQIDSAFWYNNMNLRGQHKIILDGFNKKGFHVLDPADAKEKIIDFDSFMLAFYSATPEALVIKKKK